MMANLVRKENRNDGVRINGKSFTHSHDDMCPKSMVPVSCSSTSSVDDHDTDDHCEVNEPNNGETKKIQESLQTNEPVENSSVPDNSTVLEQRRGFVKPVKNSQCKNYWGILFSLVSGLVSTLGGLIARHMKDLHPFSLAVYRFQGILLPAMIMVLYFQLVKKENVFQSVWPLTDKNNLKMIGFIMLRALCGCLGLYLYFYAIKLMPLADTKVILSSRSVFVILAARVLLGESCGIIPVIAALLSIVGMGIIAKLPMLINGYGSLNVDRNILHKYLRFFLKMGSLLATFSMLTTVISMVILRYLRGVHVTFITLVFGICGTIISFVGSAAVNRLDAPSTGKEGILLLCLAVSAFISQTTITLAMKYENAGVVVLVGTCDTIMSFVLQYFILGDAPDAYSLAGALLMATCISLIMFQKWVISLPKEHVARQCFWFALK